MIALSALYYDDPSLIKDVSRWNDFLESWSNVKEFEKYAVILKKKSREWIEIFREKRNEFLAWQGIDVKDDDTKSSSSEL